jgi:hypothetical protein
MKSLIKVLLSLLVLCVTTTAQQNLISVGRNVQVSAAHSERAHTEVKIATDPRDAKHLIACSIVKTQKPYKSSSIAYISFDGGDSWKPTLETNDYLQGSDPDCTIGPTGTTYFMAIVRNDPRIVFNKIYRSEDGGKTWLAPVSLPSYFERPSIVVDNNDGTHVFINGENAGRDLASGSAVSGFGITRSRDGGTTFEYGPTRAAFANERNIVAGIGNCAVLSDGNLACTFSHTDDMSPIDEQIQSIRLRVKLNVITTVRRGEVFNNAVTLGPLHMLRRPPGSVNIAPVIAVDSSAGPLKDRLYVVCTDVTSGRTEITFAYSADKGKTWSKLKYLNDDQPFDALDPSRGPDDFMPVVAVNRDGVVGVMWYDRRDSKDNLGWNVRFRASLDGGETFLPSVKISEAPAVFNENTKWPSFYWNAVTGGGSVQPGGPLTLDLQITGQLFNGGDYAGMMADAEGVFHPIWADNRTGVHQLWTSAIAVNGKGVLHGSPELAQLTDVTDKVSLEILAANYDRQSNTLTCETKLTNTSAQRLSGPFKVKLVSLTSEVGRQIKLINDRDQVLTMTTALDQLMPGESSQPTQLVFRLTDIQPLVRGRDIKLGLVKADLIVLGGKP